MSIWRLGVVVAIAIGIAGIGGVAQAAVSGYGPSGPSGPGAPGGFGGVLITKTICAAGGTVGPVYVNGVSDTLTVPAGAFPECVQVTLIDPPAGYRVLENITVRITHNGTVYPGPYGKALTLTTRSPKITSASLVQAWNGSAYVTDSSAVVGAGYAVVGFDSTPVTFQILIPGAIAGATVAVTGKPLLGEGILAAALVLLGAGGLVYGRRRRAHA